MFGDLFDGCRLWFVSLGGDSRLRSLELESRSCVKVDSRLLLLVDSKETCCATLAPLRLFSKEATLCHATADAVSRNDGVLCVKVDSSSSCSRLDW